MQEILLLNAALALIEKLAPTIQNAFTRGEITAAQQQAARDQYLALRAKADDAFSGPEWVIEP